MANSLWWLSCLPGAARFHRDCRRVEQAQRSRLFRILKQNRRTVFGKKFGFETIRTVEEYRRRVPLFDYEDLHPDIVRIAAGERDILFPGRPECLQPTSGTVAGSKLIPFTANLHREFLAALAPWIFGMFAGHPGLCSGKAYWSVSPCTYAGRLSPGGLPIGFQDDTEYLGPLLRGLIRQTQAVPSIVAKLTDIDVFRYVTLAFLLREKNLCLISIWSPTFLDFLLAPLPEWHGQLAADIRDGHLSRIENTAGPVREELRSRFGGPLSRRALEITTTFKKYPGRVEMIYRQLWPRLSVVSCWTDAAAKIPARNIKRALPHVSILPKGLLATEGVVSIPVAGARWPALAVRSHFYEFGAVDAPDEPFTAWQVEQGRRYCVILTTGAGLYRYRLNDVVEVKGFYGQCPLLEFVQRAGQVCDIFGEKIHEAHVVAGLENIFRDTTPAPEFVLLAPEGTAQPDRYTLFTGGGKRPPEDGLKKIGDRLEEHLRQNFHYAHCRRLGQLRSAKVCWIEADPARLHEKFITARIANGQKAGDIKPVFLDRSTNWRAILCPKDPDGDA